MRALLAGLGLIILTVIAWFGFDWYRDRDVMLSERPPEEAGDVTLEPRESVIVANLLVAYPVLQQALTSIGHSLQGTASDRAEIKCVRSDFPKFKECLDFNYEVQYGLNGAIAIERSGQMLRVNIPARFDGNGGFGGTIAKLIDTDKKNFEGAFRVSVTAAVEIDKRFCPRLVPGDVTFEWENEAQVQIIGRNEFRIFGIGFHVGPWNLDIGRHFNGSIRDQLNKALRDNADAIPCDPVRAELAKLWRHHAIPVKIPKGPPLFVNVEPSALGTTGLMVGEQGIRIAVRAAALAHASDDKGPEGPIGNLPENGGAEDGGGRLDLAMPIALSYDRIRTETLAAIGGVPVTIETEAGEITATVHNLEVYPNGERIALGVDFIADLPRRIFDASGTLWLTAVPVLEGEGSLVRLADCEITRQTDNALWNSLSAAFEDLIESEIEMVARYDLTKTSNQAISAIGAAIADSSKTGGLKLEMTDPNLRLGRVGIGRKHLTVEGLFSAALDVNLETVSVP